MINLFDLSTGMASTNVLTDRTHRDGSQVRKSWQDVNRAFDPAIVCVDEKIQVSSTKSSSSNRSNASAMKRLVATDMSKEVESKRKPPSVVARLMGLDDDVPAKEPALHSSRRNLRRRHSLDNLAATNSPQQQQEWHHYSRTAPNIHIGPKETVEFKDVYEVSEDPSRKHHILGQNFPRERSSGNKSDTKIEVVRQKFMEAKRLATNENLLHSKQFQEALEVLSSNRELFLKFLEEPSPVFLKQLNGLDTMPAPPPTKRITVLRPIKSVENKGVRETRTHQINEENEAVMRKTHQRSYSAEDFSKSTRIVVLKPSPGKPNRTGARLTPRAAPSEQTQWANFHGGLQDDASILGSRELLHGSVQYPPESHHWQDESLISSTYSNGYGGDESSFSGSEVDYIDEGGNASDPEVVSPMSQHSWDYIKRHNTPYSASTFSRASHSYSPESSVIREAKKRLSERWATVAYNEINQEQVPLPRSSTTLGEMLSLQAAKKEGVAGIISVSSNQSTGTENELAMQDACKSTLREYDEDGKSSPRNLAKSKSVPVSSSIFNDIAVNAQSANSEGTSKVVTKSGRAKLSFKGKISSFFFLGNKRPTEEKTSLSSDSSRERFGCIGYMKTQSDHNVGPDEQMSFCKDEADNSTSQAPCSSKDAGSVEVPVSSDCVSGDFDEVKSNGDPKCIHDEASPTSILDTVFEDSNSNEPESSRSTSCTERIAVRFPINSIARSLSWEDTNSCSPLLDCLKHSNLDDDDDDNDDELQCYSLVQDIVSSAGLGHLQLSMVFTGWYLPDSPLDPALCDKFLDRKEEDAKSRERRSNQKLIFDSVSTALVEIGQYALLCTYPWSRACLGTWREKLSQTLGREVWNIVSDWFYGAGSFAANKDDDAGTMLERIMEEEVEGKGWIKLLTMETDDITEQIASEVLDDLVTDTVEHLAICCSEHGISMPVPMLVPN